MNGLALALLLAEIAGCVYVLRKRCSLPVVVGPAVYISATILCLYASDFLGLLWYARLTIHLLGLAAFVLLVRNLVKRPAASIRASLSANRNVLAICTLFIAFVCLAFYANQHSIFWNWDEFSHWGAIIKLVAKAQTFHVKPNILQFQDYPPGTALFAYHMFGLSGYSEGMAIVSHDLIMLAFLMPIMASCFSGNFLFGLTTSVLCYLLVIVWGLGWDGVNIDHILSAVFAGTIAAYFTIGISTGGIFLLPIMLAALALMKQSGPYLGMVIAAVCSADMILCRLFAVPGPERGISVRHFRLVHVIWILAIFAAPLIMSASWKAYVKANHIGPVWESVELGSILPGALKCCETEREVNVTNTYFARYFGVPKGDVAKGSIVSIAKENLKKIQFTPDLPRIGGSKLTVFGFLMLSWLIIVLLLDRGVDRWRGVVTIAIVSAGMVAFSFSILLTYVYVFSVIESAEVGSFDRYHNTYILGALLIALFRIGATIARIRPIGRWVFAILFTAWACVFAYAGYPWLLQYPSEFAQSRTALRIKLKTIAEPASRLIPLDKSVYIIWPDTPGIEFYMTRFELLPRVSNLYCHSFVPVPGPPSEPCVFPEQALSDLLRGFDYTLVGDGLPRLKRDYPSIWSSDIPDNVIVFRIDKSQPLVKMVPQTP